MGVNTWCNANSVSFKCHSISVTFKFCAVLVALCAPEPRSTDSLGTQHCANFESHSNRVTFETNAISITSSIQCVDVRKTIEMHLYSVLSICSMRPQPCKASWPIYDDYSDWFFIYLYGSSVYVLLPFYYLPSCTEKWILILDQTWAGIL